MSNITPKSTGVLKPKDRPKKKSQFEPRILAFCCNWCSYAGADLAGTSRMQMPPNVRIIRVNCTGRIDITFILDALYQGADGVLISGCHPGDCHYTSGNLKMETRFALLKSLLEEAGIEPERVHLQWASAAEGDVFTEGVTEMVERVKKIGPNPARKGD
ncbi:MAG: F420-non-reducing hydrogenase iron-sulfur subunit D [Candidatus Thorarchaeota archaeon AB_25]|nr:MAG: F420-non-reducing hydrogenase iron-sulfur subunit D [Candidatus Thorarchaeota archaeon AB_25]